MYAGLTREICATAWKLIAPGISTAAQMGITNKHKGTIFVLDPTQPYAGQERLPSRAVLYAEAVCEEGNNKYANIAEAKAYLSWRTGLPSRVVQQQAPHLYVAGMTKWGGSVVRDGLVVAFSGVQAVFDEMISGWMADAIIALCRDEMTRPDGVMASSSSFVGGLSSEGVRQLGRAGLNAMG